MPRRHSRWYFAAAQALMPAADADAMLIGDATPHAARHYAACAEPRLRPPRRRHYLTYFCRRRLHRRARFNIRH